MATRIAPAGPVLARTQRRIESRGYVAATLLRLRRDSITMAALIGFSLIAMLAFLAPLITSYVFPADPFRTDVLTRYAAPSSAHPLGTDDLGRDVFARLLHAGRISIGIGVTIACVSILIGLPIGVASGYYVGRLDDFTNALIQLLGNIPMLFLLILLSVTLQPGPLGLAVLIGALSWMGTARQVRGQTLAIRERDYVLAARAMGATDRRIMLRHVFPNIISVVTVIAGFDMAGGILAESGLSYLGLGVQPPTPSWGNMLNNSLEFVVRGWWLVVSPGTAIFATVLCIFLIADGLRDALDPRLKA